MKIIPLPQIAAETFPKDVQKWIPLLLGPLNQFLTTESTALQQNLDFKSNTLGQEQNLAFTWASSTTTLPLKFGITMNAAPNVLYVGQATENKSPVILLVAWQILSGNINITDIAKVSSGVVSTLTVGASYALRVRLET